MEKNKKVIIWTKGLDDFIQEKGKIGGITVQMYFWAKSFIKNEWRVYSLSNNTKSTIEGIQLLKFPTVRFVGIFIELIYSLYFIATIKPSCILARGASRGLSYLHIYSKLFNVKLVFLGASDTDFQPGKELIKAEHDKKLYRFGLRGIQYFVVQNIFQKEQIQFNYSKNNSIIIPNIWDTNEGKEIDTNLKKSILWVGNFRKLKRPEWFIELAKQFPNETFLMVGAPIDKGFYEKCEKMASNIENLELLGHQSFSKVNSLFSNSKVFICTSEIEGFPNTFLQSWSNNMPVITTFDPSGVVERKGLGIVARDINGLKDAIISMNNDTIYKKYKNNIATYFKEHHSPQNAYQKLIAGL